jgi:uroporphyrinogen decarboxylase
MAAEATLQPIRRYGMDAAILFADILLILDAMGRNVRFEKGVGPLVDPISCAGDLTGVQLQDISKHLSPVYETVHRVKTELGSTTPLIGFCGSPWTVALYAIEGRGKTDRSKSKLWTYQKADELDAVLELLAEASAHYLAGQADAGVDALMLFDSWADGLPDDVFRQIIIKPTKSLMKHLRGLGVDLPIIGFPRGAGAMLGEYVNETGVQAAGLDTAALPSLVNTMLPTGIPVQGQLDPLLLLAGGEAMEARTRELIKAYSGRPHIFNLGHGVTPEVPIAHVERLLEVIRESGEQ